MQDVQSPCSPRVHLDLMPMERQLADGDRRSSGRPMEGHSGAKGGVMREIIIGCLAAAGLIIAGMIVGAGLMDAIHQKHDARMDQRCH